jgi:hypothetical protein
MENDDLPVANFVRVHFLAIINIYIPIRQTMPLDLKHRDTCFEKIKKITLHELRATKPPGCTLARNERHTLLRGIGAVGGRRGPGGAERRVAEAAMAAEVPCDLTLKHPPSSQVVDNLPLYMYSS